MALEVPYPGAALDIDNAKDYESMKARFDEWWKYLRASKEPIILTENHDKVSLNTPTEKVARPSPTHWLPTKVATEKDLLGKQDVCPQDEGISYCILPNPKGDED